MPEFVPPATFIEPSAHGLVPNRLGARTRKLFLEGFDLHVDIGFHDFEVGSPQILRVSIEVWVDADHFPRCDTVAKAWDYDFLRQAVLRLVEGRRFNLQETVAHAIYDMIAARAGVVGLKVSTRKPDVYPDCQAVGVELSSF
ncbi:dihydroneopterin aldolase [Sandarakinorhabdus sp.]|jgi:dihydroneopterin aldolase|uniref:dihydroneopterin aldolase n=1 Tax=Sandarakinorhabdus sp. TaxID=1916663 RepID=UPI00334035A5